MSIFNQESINRETFLPIDGRFYDQNSLNVNSDDPLGFSDIDSSFVLTPSPPVLSSLTPTPSIPEPSVISLPDPESLQKLFSPEQLSYIQLLQKQIPGLPLQSLPPQVHLLKTLFMKTITSFTSTTPMSSSEYFWDLTLACLSPDLHLTIIWPLPNLQPITNPISGSSLDIWRWTGEMILSLPTFAAWRSWHYPAPWSGQAPPWWPTPSGCSGVTLSCWPPWWPPCWQRWLRWTGSPAPWPTPWLGPPPVWSLAPWPSPPSWPRWRRRATRSCSGQCCHKK